MLRFYGIQPSEAFELDHHTVNQLMLAMPTLEAQEAISDLRVQDWPGMKKEARSKMFRDLNKLANPTILREEEKPLTTADLAALLNGR